MGCVDMGVLLVFWVGVLGVGVVLRHNNVYCGIEEKIIKGG